LLAVKGTTTPLVWPFVPTARQLVVLEQAAARKEYVPAMLWPVPTQTPPFRAKATIAPVALELSEPTAMQLVSLVQVMPYREAVFVTVWGVPIHT